MPCAARPEGRDRATGPLMAANGAMLRRSLEILTVPWLWAALGCYGLSVVVWLVGLSRVPVSQAYPLLSLGYVLNVGLAWWLLGEVPNVQRVLGIGVIVFGVVSGREVMKPFLPFTRPSIDEETIQGVAEVLRSGWIASGPNVHKLEAALSEYFGGRPVRTQMHATASLEHALLVAGIGAGDEVITPAMSFVATAKSSCGGRATGVRRCRPRHPQHRLRSGGGRHHAAHPRDHAGHFAGLPVDMDRLYAIAERHRLRVIEDAAQAIGSSWHGRRIGSFGDLVCFSFHPNKNLTTIEGGCVVGGSPEEVSRLELHRFHGQTQVLRRMRSTRSSPPGRPTYGCRGAGGPGPAGLARAIQRAPPRARRTLFQPVGPGCAATPAGARR